MEKGVMERLVQVGDKLAYTGRPVGRIKNLTVWKEYEVREVIPRTQTWESFKTTGGRFKNVPPHIDTVYVTNDKGLHFSYSIRNFLLPEGVVTDMAIVEEKTRASFQNELRDL